MPQLLRKFTPFLAVVAGLAAPVMALASPPTLYLFSEVRGQVLFNGNPVAGAKITRHYSWFDEKKSDQTVTDAEGRFTLPELTGTSRWLSIAPHEPRIVQSLNIYHDGNVYAGWFHGKKNYEKDGELGRALDLLCELTTPEGPFKNTGHFGICAPQ